MKRLALSAVSKYQSNNNFLKTDFQRKDSRIFSGKKIEKSIFLRYLSEKVSAVCGCYKKKFRCVQTAIFIFCLKNILKVFEISVSFRTLSEKVFGCVVKLHFCVPRETFRVFFKKEHFDAELLNHRRKKIVCSFCNDICG